MNLSEFFRRAARIARGEPATASPRRRASRPLRVFRLERRRVLSADFSLAGGGLLIDAFDGADAITVTQSPDDIEFTVGSGAWNNADGATPAGVSVNGATLSIDADLLAGLAGGVAIEGSGDSPLDIVFGDVDLSAMTGSFRIVGATSIGEPSSLALLTTSTATPPLLAGPTPGLHLSSMNFVGPVLEITAFGTITDEAGAQITATGDAIFTSLKFVPDADFNLDDVVDGADHAIWAANFGTASGATRAEGDANADGRVDAADYTVWSDTLGLTAEDGGIYLANEASNELSIAGDARFVTNREGFGAGGAYDIFVGVAVDDDGVLTGDRMTDSGAGVTLGGTLVDARDDGDTDRGDVSVVQDNAVEFFTGSDSGGADVGSFAKSLVVTSHAFIGDRAGATIDVRDPMDADPSDDGEAFAVIKAFGANPDGQAVNLANDAGDRFFVEDDTTLLSVADGMGVGGGGAILVGVAVAANDADVTPSERMTDSGAEVTLGVVASRGTTFDSRNAGDTARGDVTLLQDNRIELFGDNFARSLAATSRQYVVDRAATAIDLRDPADADPATDGEAFAMIKAFGSNPAGQAINLANDAGDALFVEDDTTLQSVADEFGVGGGFDLLVGVAVAETNPGATPAERMTDSGAAVTLGVTPAVGGTTFDARNLGDTRRGDVTLLQDNRIELAGANFARSLMATSREFIVDRAATTIDIQDTENTPAEAFAVFKAFGMNALGQAIVLADTAGDALTVEDDATLLSIADEAGVGGGAAILVGVDPTITDRMTDSELTGAVTPSLGGTNFDSRNAGDTQRGDVTLLQDNAIEFFGDNFAKSLVATSREFIGDRATTAIDIRDTADADPAADAEAFAVFKAFGANASGQAIVLADTAGDAFAVEDNATFLSTADESGVGGGFNIDVGVAAGGADSTATATFGSLTFLTGDGLPDASAPGLPDGFVRIHEDDDTHLTGANRAGTVELTSAGVLTDAPSTSTRITEDATFKAAQNESLVPDGTTAIVLGDGGFANSLIVGDLAIFRVSETDPPAVTPTGNAYSIDVGVTAIGTPAAATVNFGRVQFIAPGGSVRIAEDGDSLIAATNVAEDLELTADGAIEDEDTADTEITRSAELIARDATAADVFFDVVLGDAGAAFSMGAPLLFDAASFLSIQAMNASIQVDSAVNVRTGADDSVFGGTYFLSADGSIAQVGDGSATPQSLTADKIAMASLGAVLVTSVALTSSVDESSSPNLAIHAGSPVDLDSSAFDPGEPNFPTDLIPKEAGDTLAPVIDPATDEPAFFPGGPDTAAIGSDYAIVAIVEGDAKIGDVADPTSGAQPNRVGVVVGPSAGNAFLKAKGVAGGEAGDLVFSSMAADPTAPDVAGGTVAQMSGGVLTAVAAGELSIDTTDPDEPTGSRTTFLRSANGAVTSVASFGVIAFPDLPVPIRLFTDDSPVDAIMPPAPETVGPRFQLNPPGDEANAATTGLVLASNPAFDPAFLADFEAALAALGLADFAPAADEDGFVQLLTFAAGSRGEDNLVVVIDSGEVLMPLRFDLPPERSALNEDGDRQLEALLDTAGDPLPGVIEHPEVGVIGDVVDGATPVPGLTTASTFVTSDGSPIDFRVVTLTHVYASAFIPENPLINSLPTAVTLFNDPAINLFDQFVADGQTDDDGQGGDDVRFRDLNSNAVAFSPRVAALPPPGFFLPIARDEVRPPIDAEQPLRSEPPTFVSQRVVIADDRAVVAAGVEVIRYGRIDPDTGQWLEDAIPGEQWPQEWEDVDGDFLRDIRDAIDNGPSSEGLYRISVSTGRGEQPLEEWYKGDVEQEQGEQEQGEAVEDADALPKAPPTAPQAAPPAAPAATDGAAIGPTNEAALGAVGVVPAPQPTPSGSTAAFAPVVGVAAALGAWRRRFLLGDQLEFDQDGVGFSRGERRRRRAKRSAD